MLYEVLFTSTLTRQPIVFGGQNTYSVLALVISKRKTCIAGTSVCVVAPPMPKETGWASNGTHVYGRLDKSLSGFSRIRGNRSMQAKCMVSYSVSHTRYVPVALWWKGWLCAIVLCGVARWGLCLCSLIGEPNPTSPGAQRVLKDH